MIKRIALGAMTFAAINLISEAIGSRPAAACNRLAGCTMDVLHESYEMMHTGKMNEAMRADQDNIDAFRRLREAERPRSSHSNEIRR